MSGMNDLAVLPLGQKLGSGALSYANIQKLLGSEVGGPDGKVWRLVQLTEAAGNAAPAKKVFQQVLASAWTVKSGVTVGAAINTHCSGIGHPDQVALVTGDLFYAQVAGRAEVIAGDDGDTIALGELVRVSADTDLGKVRQEATTVTLTHATIGVAVDTGSVDNVAFTIDILGKLRP